MHPYSDKQVDCFEDQRPACDNIGAAHAGDARAEGFFRGVADHCSFCNLSLSHTLQDTHALRTFQQENVWPAKSLFQGPSLFTSYRVGAHLSGVMPKLLGAPKRTPSEGPEVNGRLGGL